MILGGAARVLGPVVGAVIFWPCSRSPTTSSTRRVRAATSSNSILTTTQVGAVRLMLVGLGLMLLMIFRPQGIFGDRREIALDAR